MLAHSILTMETVLNITREIVRMDDVNNTNLMPLSAVLLLRNVVRVGKTLATTHNRTVQGLEDILASLKRASSRWEIAHKFLTASK
jgi:transcriptional regulator of aromatic amino acid metabolism